MRARRGSAPTPGSRERASTGRGRRTRRRRRRPTSSDPAGAAPPCPTPRPLSKSLPCRTRIASGSTARLSMTKLVARLATTVEPGTETTPSRTVAAIAPRVAPSRSRSKCALVRAAPARMTSLARGSGLPRSAALAATRASISAEASASSPRAIASLSTSSRPSRGPLAGAADLELLSLDEALVDPCALLREARAVDVDLGGDVGASFDAGDGDARAPRVGAHRRARVAVRVVPDATLGSRRAANEVDRRGGVGADLEPGQGPGDVDRALEEAARVMRGRGGRRVEPAERESASRRPRARCGRERARRAGGRRRFSSRPSLPPRTERSETTPAASTSSLATFVRASSVS